QIPSLQSYNGIVLWQDRRNSTVIYDANGNVIKCYVVCGGNTPTSADYQANNVTATSPGLTMNDANRTLRLTGAVYQPRGAWYTLEPGTTNINQSPLQIFTGMLRTRNGGGNVSVTLTTPINQVIGYVPALIL